MPQPKRNSTDRMNAWKHNLLPHFASELTKVVVQHFGEYFYVNDVAQWFETNAATASAWLWGKQLPDPQHCHIIAERTEVYLELKPGEGYDYWMALAGRLTMGDLREEASKNRHVWRNGEYIFKALQLTLNTSWRFDSRSQWKQDAEAEMEGWVVKKMTPQDFQRVAYRVARWVDAWKQDRYREIPLSQRQVAVA
jgi:hypothetical protein